MLIALDDPILPRSPRDRSLRSWPSRSSASASLLERVLLRIGLPFPSKTFTHQMRPRRHFEPMPYTLRLDLPSLFDMYRVAGTLRCVALHKTVNIDSPNLNSPVNAATWKEFSV